ncbi:MAG TPA: dephospho-CoA kinase [Sphingobacteriaceae bacterium]|nr:dephospho-CoA kinase [Sphingobacteriaceae bacterium]
MLVIGLGGGIGTGKSRVAAQLAEWGAVVISADQLARQAVEPGTPGYQAVVARFGAQVVNPDGTLNRQRLGRLVFGDERARQTLEAIIHPWVRQEMARRVEELRASPQPPPAVIIEVPLLRPDSPPVPMDEIWVVHTSLETRIRRVMERDGLSRDEILARIQAQPSQDDLLRSAHAVIDNDGPWEQTVARLQQLWQSRVAGKERPI